MRGVVVIVRLAVVDSVLADGGSGGQCAIQRFFFSPGLNERGHGDPLSLIGCLFFAGLAR